MKLSFLNKNKKVNKKERRPLTKKEIILLTLLILFAEGYFCVDKILLPQWDEYKTVISEIESKELVLNNLRKDNANINGFIENEKALQYKLNKLAKELPPYISQQDIIMTVSNYAKDRGVAVDSLNFDKDKLILVNNFLDENKKSDKDKLNNESNSSDESNNEKLKNTKAPVVLSKYINVAFKTATNSLFNFLDDLEKNQKKIIVKEIAINRGKDASLEGNIKFQYVGYKEDATLADFKIEVPQINGKTSPFAPYKGYKEDENNVKYIGSDFIPNGYDGANLFLNINRIDDEIPKFVIGQFGKSESEIYYNAKDKIKGKMVVSKKDDKYICSYYLVNEDKKVVTEVIPYNGVITMEVNAKRKLTDDDKISLVFDVENNTDVTFEIFIRGDDNVSPRFLLGKKEGNIQLK